MNTKKIIAMFSAIIITGVYSVSNLSAENLNNSNGLSTSNQASEVIPEDGSYLNSSLYIGSNNSISSRSALPSKVDLSCDNPYFPEIGNQGSIGSCAAFATTYYQYSYEVKNK